MDTIVFHCFSATGNTARSVARSASALVAQGHHVSVLPITADSIDHPPEANHLAVHVIAFPVLGFGPPDNVKRYIRHLSQAVTKETGLRAAILASCGGEGFQALEETELMLRRRGFEVLASAYVSYPFNWTMVTPAPKADAAALQLSQGDRESDAFCASLSRQLLGQATPGTLAERSLHRSGWFARIWSGLVQALFAVIGRRAMGSFFTASAACTGCGLCATHCPAKTIRMHQQRGPGLPSIPAWGASCTSCNRCINLCPEAAIQVSVAKLVIQTGLNLVALVAIIQFTDRLVPDAGVSTGIPHTIVDLLAGVALFALAFSLQLGPLNWLLNRAAARKPLKAFFAFSWTSHFRRYLAPGFVPDRIRTDR